MSAPPERRRLGAGEGGRLPRGLSLFRFVLFSFLMSGALYGGAALYFDAPPPPGYLPPGAAAPLAWSPSPLWLPVYLATQARMGIHLDPDGFAFHSALGRAIFAMCCIGIGILLGGVAGWLAGEQVRRALLRRKYAPPPVL